MTGSAPRTRLEDTSARSRGRLITSLEDLSRARLRLGSKAAWLENERPWTERPGDSISYLGECGILFTGAVGALARGEERLWVRWLDMENLYFFFGGGGGVSHGTEERAFVRRVH